MTTLPRTNDIKDSQILVSPELIQVTSPFGDDKYFKFDNGHFDRYFGDGDGGGNNKVNLHVFKLM